MMRVAETLMAMFMVFPILCLAQSGRSGTWSDRPATRASEDDLSAAVPKMSVGTLGYALQNGGRLLAREDVTALFARGGQWSTNHGRTGRSTRTFNPDHSITGPTLLSKRTGTWSVDDKGQLCVTGPSDYSPSCAHLVKYNGKLYITYSATDPRSSLSLRTFTPLASRQ